MVARRFNTSADAQRSTTDLQQFLHGDYKYFKPDWDLIRDAMAGERRIKDRGQTYLPALDAEYGTSYETYKRRASFVNMTGRTVIGMVGTVFRKPAKIHNVKPEILKNVTIDGLDFHIFAKKIAMEIAGMGRVGVLVDMSPDGDSPYFSEYIAENILAWRTQIVDGRQVPVYVLLREIVDETPTLDSTLVGGIVAGNLRARYRALILENGVYKQRIFQESDNGNVNLKGEFKEVTPEKNGKPFDYIPFVFIGPMTPTADVQKSPVLDIATLNISHYCVSAQLEHGRYYTALPVYWVEVGASGEQGEYFVGPSTVWEVQQGSKPGILEYYGTGLTALANSMIEKEEHIAQLGGRIMGIRPQAVSESDNIYKMKQINEMAILLNLTEAMSAGLTLALTWYLDWIREPTEGVVVKLNQDFKGLNIAAREMRAIAVLYQSGILPVSEVYRVLQDAEFINEDLSQDDFVEMLDNLENFPGQPDVEAMHEGYPDAQGRLTEKLARLTTAHEKEVERMTLAHEKLVSKRQLDQDADVQDKTFKQARQTQEFERQEAEKERKSKEKTAVKVAKATPKAPAAKKPAAKKK